MASCKFEGGKYKGAVEAKAHMRHNDISPERRAIAKKKNKHIDLAKCMFNFNMLGLSYEERCKKYDDRIAYLDNHGNTNKRKDRVTMQCIEVPVPKDLPRDCYHDWFVRVADIMIDRYGEENFIDADFHFDEEHEYRKSGSESETKELVMSRVHGHYMIIPVVNGKLNCKQISLRRNMKILNQKVEEMTQQEFGCSFMTGTKKKSFKKVEELKQESENAELLYQMEQERQALDTRTNALDAREDELNEKEDELLEKEKILEQREKAVQDLEEQKEYVRQELEAVRKKEENLDQAVRAVSELDPLDEAVEIVLDRAVVEVESSPGISFPYVARRYLEYVQNTQKKEAELICLKAGHTPPGSVPAATKQPEKKEAVLPRSQSARAAQDDMFATVQTDDDSFEL